MLTRSDVHRAFKDRKTAFNILTEYLAVMDLDELNTIRAYLDEYGFLDRHAAAVKMCRARWH